MVNTTQNLITSSMALIPSLIIYLAGRDNLPMPLEIMPRSTGNAVSDMSIYHTDISNIHTTEIINLPNITKQKVSEKFDIDKVVKYSACDQNNTADSRCASVAV